MKYETGLVFVNKDVFGDVDEGGAERVVVVFVLGAGVCQKTTSEIGGDLRSEGFAVVGEDLGDLGGWLEVGRIRLGINLRRPS